MIERRYPNPKKVQAWKFEDLRNFVDEVKNSTDEYNWFDFKEKIHDKAKEACKDFASFANFIGGYIIYGVTDDYKLVGCKSCSDISKNIGGLLEPNMLDPIIEWVPLIKILKPRDNSREFRIIYINESSIAQKPHFVCGTVYIRKKGESTPIKNQSEFNQLFFGKDSFNPAQIDNLALIFDWLKRKNYHWMAFDCFSSNYLQNLKHHLLEILREERQKKKKKYIRELLSIFENMTQKMKDLDMDRSSKLVTESTLIQVRNDEQEQVIKNIEKDIKKFINSYKRMFND